MTLCSWHLITISNNNTKIKKLIKIINILICSQVYTVSMDEE